MLKKNKKHNYAGFSFMEVMLSVAVLSIGVMGVLPLFTSALRQSLDSRDQIIGAMLAQEGVELVQNLRDNNFKNRVDAFSGAFPADDTVNCRIDFQSALDCSSTLFRLYADNVTNFYKHSTTSATITKFRRRVNIDYSLIDGSDSDAENAAKAKVYVTAGWGAAGLPSSPNSSNCNTNNKCAFAIVTLTKW
ncbi:MAG: prepilin-type N-terminal cleavage/methylation domain-containing protein [Parcubacteria group bacterium]|jgi:Tfp pilus assembly protein PilV